jgi:uncharacterized protein YjbI with pentapeptide repeats
MQRLGRADEHLPLHNQTVAVGLGGHGASPGTAAEYSVERYGADVAEVIRALALPSAVLACHSMGCRGRRCSYQTTLPAQGSLPGQTGTTCGLANNITGFVDACIGVPSARSAARSETDMTQAPDALVSTWAARVPSGLLHIALVFASILHFVTQASAADHMTAEQVRAAVAAVSAGSTDLSEKDMTGDDLTGLDLSGANLSGANVSGANLHGVKLVGANLTGADLTNADLTFAWIVRANFTRAHLHGATMQTIVTSTGMDNTPDQAAIFVGADLSDASITVHFSFDDMRGANFTHAHMTVVIANQSMGLLRSEFISAKLDGADFTDAGLGHVTFRFAKLNGARFNGADLSNTDFAGADLTNADFTGANVRDATFESATLAGVRGLNLPTEAVPAK